MITIGQYHIPISIDRKEFFSPHRLGDGLKALEQALSGPGGVPTALHALLTVSNGRGGGDYGTEHPLASEVLGRWGGTRVAIVGDYAEPGDIPNAEGIEPVLYNLCGTAEDVQAFIDSCDERADLAAKSESGKLYGASEQDYVSWATLARAWGPFTDISELIVQYFSEGVDDYYHVFTYGERQGWNDRTFEMERRAGV